MKKMTFNFHLYFGILAVLIYFGLSRLIALPDFLLGFCLGIMLTVLPFGIYKQSKRHAA